eukprot:gene6790-7556_t
MKCVTVVFLLHVLSCLCVSFGEPIYLRYVKREEVGSPSRLRFTSGSYGYYNASTEESHAQGIITSDMKMGIYVYDAHTKIDYELDKVKKFSVKSEQIEDFVFLRLKVEGLLNSDLQSTYKIDVIARNRRTKEEIDRTTVYLHVLDINEFTPTFANPDEVIQKTVSEDLKIGTTILKVKASDSDVGKNGELFYSILSSEVFLVQEFSLHPHTGELTLVQPLNFNKKHVYSFHIVAQDKCPFEKLRRSSSPISIKITVKKALTLSMAEKLREKRQGIFDAKTPLIRFTKATYYQSIPEISPPFTPVVRVAVQNDGKNKLPNVVFGFHRGNEKGNFQINSHTGQIYTIKDVDYEKDEKFNLVVIAYHKGLIKGRANVVINILDSNDHSPTFPALQAEISIPEETSVGQIVYTARASDLDTGINSELIYSIANINSTYFDIDTYSGNVTVAKRLDRDGIWPVPSVQFLLIKAMDLGFPIRREGRMLLKIKIKKVNDNPPTLPFLECSVSIAQNTATGFSVMKIEPIDIDRSRSFKFQLGSKLLNINEHSGEISVGDLSDKKHDKLHVIVSDGKFTSQLNLSVAVTPGRDSKKVNITCSNSPKYSEAKMLIARRNRHEKTILIEKFKPIAMPQSRVHRPIFLEKPDNTIFLREDLPVGSFVTSVLAVDKELKCYGLVVYSIVSGNNNQDSNFDIDMLNGTVFLSGTIDREQKSFYDLRIRASDTDSPPHYTDIDVRIEILDVNDNGPKFTKDKYIVQVSEDLKPGSMITIVQAKDPDERPNGDITYSMVSDLHDLFQLGKYTGLLRLKKNLDYEKQKGYIIHIQALDSSNENQKISQAVIEVEVLDINDTPPTCLPKFQSKEISKEFPAGAVIGKVNAFDPDSGLGGKVFFEIEKGKPSRLFTIDREYGIIRTNLNTIGSFDEHFINISVRVTDHGVPALSSNCYFICILKPSTSFERPAFQTTENPVIRNLQDGSNFKELAATLEGTKTLEYSLVDGNGLGHFIVDSKTGTISKVIGLEQSISNFWLTLNAHLKDNPSVYSNLAILFRAGKTYDKPPYFDPSVYRVSVKENEMPHTEVAQLFAVDPNIGSNLTNLVYKIISGNDLGHFQVTLDGVVKTTVALDREQHERYSLNISVHNINMPNALSFASVTVTVNDVNDNTPIFFDDPEEKIIIEQDPIDTDKPSFIHHVAAYDHDIGTNAAITYSIEDPANKFQINAHTGVITSKSKLVAGESFFIPVTIQDGGIPAKASYSYYASIVHPKPARKSRKLAFLKKVYTVHLSESDTVTKPGDNIGKMIMTLSSIVTARKLPNEYMVFNIEAGNDDNKFAVKSIPGVDNLVLISFLDHEVKEEYDLTIRVTDGQQSDTTVIKVIVDDSNDNYPMTSQSCYQAKITENDMSGNVFAQIEALDPDSISKGKLSYELLSVSSPSMKAFSIDAVTGKIRTKQNVLDREKEKRYILTLVADDHTAIPVLRTPYCVAVDVKDANDNKPRFTKSVYKTHVDSFVSVGEPLVRLFAMDYDIGTNALMRFTIARGNNGGHFAVHSATGIISLAKKFTLPKTKVIRLSVEVSDSGAQQQFRDQASVEVVFIVNAAPDPRQNGRLGHASSPAENIFAVDASLTGFSPNRVEWIRTGFAQIGKSPRRLEGSAVNARPVFHSVNLERNSLRRKYCNAQITVMPGLPWVAFRNQTYRVLIDENTPAKPVLEIVVPNARANFKIRSGNGGKNCASLFEIDYLSGVVSSKGPMDAETIKRCKFTIEAWDGVSFSRTIDVVVLIKDVNDNPPVFFNKTYSGSIDEGSGRGSEILDSKNKPLFIKAVDKDSGDNARVGYSVVESSAKRYFDIHPSTGKLVTRQVLDREKVEHFKFHILAFDHGSPKLFALTEVSVKVNDINDKMPEFEKQIYRVKLYTPVFNNTVVATVKAADGDTNLFGSVTYQLLSHKDKFTISPSSGNIWTKNAKLLTGKEYALQIAASDGIFTSTCQVKINLHPIRSSSLRFSRNVFHAFVTENDKHSRTLVILNVVGYEIGECIMFSIVNPTEGFVIDANTGVIKKQSGSVFDREQQAYYILIVQAHLKRDSSQVAQVMVNVTVEDANDNRPVFTNEPYYQSVHIDADAGSLLIVVHAVDADYGSNAAVRYDIASGSFGKFAIDEITGAITVKERFVKGKTPAKFLIEVNAHDLGDPQLTTSTIVEVPVVNEDMPIFDKNYQLSVAEYTAIGSSIGRIIATGPQGRAVYYSIENGDDDNQFSLDFNTGEMTVIDTLDRLVKPVYNLTVQATDSRSGSWSITGCTITITDINNHRPMFGLPMYVVSIAEDAAKKSSVAVIQATDRDVGLNADIRYSLSSLDDDEKVPFAIHRMSGKISVTGTLDYETKPVYHLKISAMDRGQPSLGSSTFLTVNLQDVNDNAPYFDQPSYSFMLEEYKRRGQFVGKVQCIDPDYGNGSRIRYVILDSTLVRVETRSGIVRLNRKPPRKAQFEIHCTDEKHSVSAKVILVSRNSNEHSPVFGAADQTINVRENESPGFITIVAAKDYDQGSYGTVTYSIDSNILKKRFYINPTIGDIFSKVSMDREKEKDGRIILPIRASDGGGRFVYSKVTINIMDGNDNDPVFEFSSYEATVSSATRIGSTILTVKAFDKDSGENGEITYSMTGLDDSVPLKINKETGALTLTGTPMGKAYQFAIKALDNGYPVRESAAQIRVNVVPPSEKVLQFQPSTYSVQVPESNLPGYRIATVKATSGDSSDNVNYRILNGNLPSTNVSSVFTIDKHTGAIHLSGNLDYETVASYNLLVNAYDVNKPESKAFKLIKVVVENVNDNPPVFESKEYNITIPENIALNSKIIQAKANDADDLTGSHLRYKFIKSTSQEIKKLFAVDPRTGDVRTIGRLNTQKHSKYDLHIKVIDKTKSDSNKFYDTTVVRITILDTNDSPPVFVTGRRIFTVREDHVVGEKVAAVLAQDADKNPTIRYYIVSGNDRGHFRIDNVTGEIRLVSALDREAVPRHTLMIVAYDGVFTSTITVVVVVSDTNDNRPTCSKAFYLVKVTEGTSTSTPVARIEAKDPDSVDKLTYTLQGDGVGKFFIHEKTGELFPRGNIDREKQSTCDIKVLVTDAAGHMCHSDVFVDVLDKNDNKPIFTQDNYVIPVRENASISAMLSRVQALDADKGSNRRISYRLASTGSGIFSIGSKTGIIILEKALDKKRQQNHSIIVEAVDAGDPALSSSAKVTIIVLGKSDIPPEFTKSSYVFTLSENAMVGDLVGTVKTAKRVGQEEEKVVYELVSGDGQSFAVDKNSGEIHLLKKVDYEKAKTATLNIRAKFSNLPSLSSVVIVLINIKDENDNSPVFVRKTYAASVDENVRAGTFVVQVFADDVDEKDNGRVQYRFVNTPQSFPFKIDKMSGVISVTGAVDREEKDNYILKVRAYDLGTPPLSTDITVNVSVADLNDNAPEVDHPNATKIIQNDLGPGSVLFTWAAKDRDTNKNGAPFTYTVLNGDNMFLIMDVASVEGNLMTSGSINSTGKSTYNLVIRVTDSGSPPQSSLCYLTLHIVKPSMERPVITEPTMFFLAVKKPGELVTVGRVRVTDKDKDDLHQFKIHQGNDDNTFSIGTFSGVIKGRPRQGIYTISVEVSDGKYLVAAVIKIIVNSVSETLYQNSVVITALDISADEFVRDKMRHFANYIRRITSANIENIAIWGVQTRYQRRKARNLHSTTDTDIAFAVKRTDEDAYIKQTVLEKSLKSTKDRLERELGLSFIVSVTDQCATSPCPANKKCVSVVKPVSEKKATSSSDAQAIRFNQGHTCQCLDGSKGPDCTGITACSSNPCKNNEKCTPFGISYKCQQDIDADAIQLDGKDYVSYSLRNSFDSMFKSIAVSFRTEATEGYLFYAKGHDYCFLEISKGKIRFKFDFGTGPGIIRIDDIQVNDGRWHDVIVIRNVNHATVSLDGGKFKAHGKAKGEHVKIDLNGNEVYFGAGVDTPGKAENGFKGCMRHAKLNDQILPWSGNNSLVSSGRSYGVKKSCKDSDACRRTSCPLFSECINTLSSYRCQCMPGHTGLLCKPRVTCADNPCRNSGICTYFQTNGVIEYRCKCFPPYSGAQCQVYSGLCASNPCRNGGQCVSVGDNTGYKCKCPARFGGRNCELDNDPCASSPCYNGAKCVKTRYDFKCECPAGTKGKRCGYGEYCKLHSCGHGGKCEERLDGPICVCNVGYSGSNCQSDVNECLRKPSPCKGVGTCINTIGSYFCNCTDGTKSKTCYSKGEAKERQTGVSMMTVVYIVCSAILALIIVIVIVCCRRKCKRHVEYSPPNNQGGPDVKYPYACYELDHFPPRIADVPPEYGPPQDAFDDFPNTAMYDPSLVAASVPTSEEDSCIKQPVSDIDSPLSSPLKQKCKEVDSNHSSPRASAVNVDGKGSASDVSETGGGDRLNGPYHWDYSEVPEDVVNRSKPTRSGSKEGSRMGLTYNLAYEDSPNVNDPTAYRRASLTATDADDVSLPKRPTKKFRLSWQSLVEPTTPPTRHLKKPDVPAGANERSPVIKRAGATSRCSDGSYMEPYESVNTRLTADDFNNRYSLAIEGDTSSLYLQDMLGGEYPAPPSETCPSDIDSCTRPSMSVAFSEVDDMHYPMRQRRMLPSEISCLDADGMTETSYNSDDDADNFNEKDPLDPDETRKLERDIKILFKDIKSRTEADV